jgi:hypothetical protein
VRDGRPRTAAPDEANSTRARTASQREPRRRVGPRRVAATSPKRSGSGLPPDGIPTVHDEVVTAIMR